MACGSVKRMATRMKKRDAHALKAARRKNDGKHVAKKKIEKKARRGGESGEARKHR